MSNGKLFENQKIRCVWIETDQKWCFSVADAVECLIDSADVKTYWRQFKLETVDGKKITHRVLHAPISPMPEKCFSAGVEVPNVSC